MKHQLDITKGEWKQNGINGIHSKSTCVALTQNNEYRQQDAILIADAGNTYQSCGELPSELLRQGDELKKALSAIKELSKNNMGYGNIIDETLKNCE